MAVIIKDQDVGVVPQPTKDYDVSTNIILGKTDQWLQWYKDRCYAGSWQRKKLNLRRKKYYYNNQKKILKKLRVIYKEKGTD